jgi:hypothetical protein
LTKKSQRIDGSSVDCGWKAGHLVIDAVAVVAACLEQEDLVSLAREVRGERTSAGARADDDVLELTFGEVVGVALLVVGARTSGDDRGRADDLQEEAACDRVLHGHGPFLRTRTVPLYPPTTTSDVSDVA